MNKPLVSIITPTYNHEKYIADCIESVLQQTYNNWEMIIVDDGSSDKTYEKALEYSEKDSRIKLFTQKNIGIFRLAETYNFALSKSEGKYIAILEGDDVWVPEKLELQLVDMEKDERIVLSFGNAYSTAADLSYNYYLTSVSDKPESVVFNNPVSTATKTLLFSNFIVALTVMIRKTTLEKIGGFKQSHQLPLVDLTTWIQLSLHGKFSFIETPLGKWRFYPNQITKTYTAEIHEGFYKFALDFFLSNQDVFSDSQISIKSIKKHFHKKLVEAHSRSGRYKLIRKDFSGARKNYLRSIFCYGLYSPVWKLRSLTGLIFSLFHADVEGFARILGKASYK